MARKIKYEELAAGYEFPPAAFTIDAGTAASYLAAVANTSPLFQDTGLIPPLAVAARAIAALTEGFDLPPGTIHVSQEYRFLQTARAGQTFTTRFKVTRKQDRGRFHMLTVGVNIFNEAREVVVSGQTSFVVPG